jgi:hypothetical protein
MVSRLELIQRETITDKWVNERVAQMRYNSVNIWYQVVGYHYEGETIYLDNSDIELDTVNFPVIATGITAYLIKNIGKNEKLIFDKYYKCCSDDFMQIESRKPGSSMRNLDIEFYPIHVSQECEHIKFSDKIHSYLSSADIELIHQYIGAYFKYIKQVFAPKETNESVLSVPDWCIVFYYADEAGTQEGNKIDRMEMFIKENNVISPSGNLTTKLNFKKEYHEIENRINSKNDKNPLPPERIENILPYLKNNKKALQAAENDIEHLSDEIEENKKNTY